MSSGPLEILKEYWKHDTFRPGQLEIIEESLKGRDVLGLLPTGAGKSVCFQVPGMMRPGLSLVVSPLIALMKDQVDNLQKRGIRALALHSGLTWNEIKLTMENALQGHYKFMYVSPERLATENFREYLPNLNISQLVVDEAHCISQWGYDFRPPYLQIAECRELLPGVPLIALTASAPLRISKDICDKLKFRDPYVHTGDFDRPNLHYHVLNTENRSGMLLRALAKTKGSSIVFSSTRAETEETCRFLKEKGVDADFYHAGLNAVTRSRKQDAWMKDKVRVMVCTNAFGMGVDKPGVRFVIHQKAPLSPEAYYQEAGRAGRDGQDAWCILLNRDQDFADAEVRIKDSFPDPADLDRMYNAVLNHLNVAAGAGMLAQFPFNLAEIAEKYNLRPFRLMNGIKIMEVLGFWALSESIRSPSRLHMKSTYADVFDFKVRNKPFENLIDILLRSYGGVFDAYVTINELMLARRLYIEAADLQKMLMHMHKSGILEYLPASDQPRLTLLEPRHPYPKFDSAKYNFLLETKLKSLADMRDYAQSSECRSVYWEKYYSGRSGGVCGHCDHCSRRKKEALQHGGLEKWGQEIRAILGREKLDKLALLDKFPTNHALELKTALRWHLDHRFVLPDAEEKLYWNEKDHLHSH